MKRIKDFVGITLEDLTSIALDTDYEVVMEMTADLSDREIELTSQEWAISLLYVIFADRLGNRSEAMTKLYYGAFCSVARSIIDSTPEDQIESTPEDQIA